MQDKTTRMGVRAWAEPTPHRVALPASVAHPPVSCQSGWLNRLAEGPGSSQVLCTPCWGSHVLCVPCWGSHVSVSYGDPKALGAFRVMQPACLSSALCGRPNSLARALPCSESPSAVFPETLLPCSPCPARAHPKTLLALGGQGPPTAPSSLGLDLFLLLGTQRLLHEETPKGSSRASLLEPPLRPSPGPGQKPAVQP